MPPALGTSESSSDAAQLRLVATVTLALSLSGISDIEGRKVHLKLDFFPPPKYLIKAPWAMAVLPQDKRSMRSLGSKLVSPKRQVRV